MAGYYGYSKSNNAVEAEYKGYFPATVLAKRLGVHAGAIRELLCAREWHHTSKFYNCTDYYSEEEAMEILEELKAWRPPKQQEKEYPNCSGQYLVWSGTRNYPRARVVRFDSCKVTEKGDWFIIHLPAGDVRKNRSTRGLVIKAGDKRLVDNS